jgi:hypothetical protein
MALNASPTASSTMQIASKQIASIVLPSKNGTLCSLKVLWDKGFYVSSAIESTINEIGITKPAKKRI